MKKKVLLVLIITVILIIVCVTNKQNFIKQQNTMIEQTDNSVPCYVIEGTVIDYLKNPIKEVKIELYKKKKDKEIKIYETTTDDNGKYVIYSKILESSTTSEYYIVATKPKYVSSKITDIKIDTESDINRTIKIGKIELKLGDINQDGQIDLEDLISIMDNYGKDSTDMYDLNGDSKVNQQDKEIIKQNYTSQNIEKSINEISE